MSKSTVRRAISRLLSVPGIRPITRRLLARRRRAAEAKRRIEREAAERRTAERVEAFREVTRLERIGDSAGAFAVVQQLSSRFPEGEKIAISTSRLAARWEQWDVAFAAFDGLSANVARRPSVRLARVDLLEAAEQFEEAMRLLDELSEEFPDDDRVCRRRLLALIEQGRFDEVEASLQLTGDRDDVRLRLLDAMFDTAGALEIARRRVAERPEQVGLRIDLCWRLLRELEQEVEPWPDAEGLLKAEVAELVRMDPDEPRFVQLMIELAVRRDAVDDVEELLGSVPTEWRHRWVFSARSWVARRRGQPIEVVRQIWEELERHHFVPQVRPCDPAELSYRSFSEIPRDADEIRLLTVVRNERWRIPWFLAYYRTLGVDRFFFVDNGSTDDTLELLLEEPDVHVFHTTESYSRGRSGMVWVNQLVADFGTVGWNIYADVDEALVFPGVDELGLRGLVEYMEERGHEVIAGHMLDMHAPEATDLDADGFERDFIGNYPMFDPVYRTAQTLECPYFRVRGGVRRHLGSMPEQTKTPLFRAGRNIRMLASSHVVTPAVVSDVSCVFLHYKLAGDYRATFEADVEENNRRPFCRRRHLGYLAALEKFGDDQPDLTSEVSVRYESWRTLDDLGFIDAPQAFRSRIDS